jgi:hypothetical protein
MTKESIRDRISRVESGLFTTQVAQIPTGAITLPTGHQGPGMQGGDLLILLQTGRKPWLLDIWSRKPSMDRAR